MSGGVLNLADMKEPVGNPNIHERIKYAYSR